MLSTRFEHSLRRLADKVALLREQADRSDEKDRLLVNLADARRAASSFGDRAVG